MNDFASAVMLNNCPSTFRMMGSQGRGQLHCHTIIFYPYSEYDPRVDMRIHYDPRLLYLKYVMKMQGMSPSAIHRSAGDGAPLVVKRLNEKVVDVSPFLAAGAYAVIPCCEGDVSLEWLVSVSNEERNSIG